MFLKIYNVLVKFFSQKGGVNAAGAAPRRLIVSEIFIINISKYFEILFSPVNVRPGCVESFDTKWDSLPLTILNLGEKVISLMVSVLLFSYFNTQNSHLHC